MVNPADRPTVRFHGVPRYSWYVLGLMFSVNTVNFIDRQIVGILQEDIRKDLALSDSQLGFLSMGFSMFYVIAGFPIAWFADRGNRRNIIAYGIAAFSFMTAACGAAQNFIQLAITRFGVGVGEAAAGPAGGSLLSDYFPPERRAGAFAINACAVHFGIFAGFALGGWVAEAYGWRMAFLVAGVPGIAIATLIRLTMREPERGAMDSAPVTVDQPSISEIARTLWSKRSLRHLAVANMATVMAGASFFAWGPSYLIRYHGMEKAEVGLWMGVLTGVSGLAGTLSAGFLTDRLAGLSPRVYFWIPAGSALLCIIPAIGFCLWPNGDGAILFIAPFVFFSGMYLGPVYAIAQTLIPARMRALSSAVLNSFTMLVGAGVGPQVVGIASDAFRPAYGDRSVGIALLGISLFVFVWGATHYLLGARYVRTDLEAL